MIHCYILYEVFPYDDPSPEDIAVYPKREWAEKMLKENQEENPDSEFKIVESLLAEEGDVIL